MFRLPSLLKQAVHPVAFILYSFGMKSFSDSSSRKTPKTLAVIQLWAPAKEILVALMLTRNNFGGAKHLRWPP